MDLSKLKICGNLIDASAGTGKTYQLASRFISLLALGVPAEHMIALTFTRKAAGEFLERIITELAKAAENEKYARRMWKRINSTLCGFNVDTPSEKTGCAPLCPEVQLDETHASPEFYLGKLREVLQSLSSLNLSTLDSFFNKVVSSHSLELGLSDVSLLSDEQLEQVQFQTLQSFLAYCSRDENMRELFPGIFREISEDKLHDMMKHLQSYIASFMAVYRNNTNQDLWGNAKAFHLPTPEELPYPEVPTDELIRRHEKEIAELSKHQGCKAFETFIKKMKEWSYDGISRIEKALEKAKATDTPELRRLRELAKPIFKQRRHDILRRCLNRSKGMCQLLQLYNAHYKKEVLATGKLEFDDITRFMPILLQNNELDIQDRLDFNLRHWMLDEFQDTSPQQWEALEPLLNEALSKKEEDELGNHTLFVVGDEKQSIYGWRGASPELFNMLKSESFWSSHLHQTTMAASRRSSVEIMDFVNRVFSREIAAGIFPKHTAAGDQADKPGYVRVRALPALPQDEQVEEACREIGRLLTQELRFMDGGITAAILVRRNEEGAHILQWLKQHHPNLPVTQLSDTKVAATTPMGEMLLCFFRWLMHPADAYCSAVLRESPLGRILKQEEDEYLPWAAWKNKLERVGYAAILTEIAGKLPPVSAEQDATLKEWITAAMEFDTTGGTTEEWVFFIESKSRQDNPPKSHVHIMTMHKSKGLEYDAVILPMLGSNSICDPKRMSYLIARDESGQISGILLPPGNKKQRQAWPELQSHIEEWQQTKLKEGRNLLYVALTRAARANYILLNGKTLKEIKDEPTTYGAMLKEALNIPDCEPVEITTVFEQAPDNADWHKRTTTPTVNAPEEEPITLLPPTYQRKHSTPSAKKTSETPEPLNQSATPDATAADFGTAVHECFEQIEWLSTDAKLPTDTPEQRVVAAAMQQPEVRALFTYAPGLEAYCEQPIEAISAKNEWISGTIDRLILTTDAAGRPTGAHIIDFKTNALHPTDEEQDVYKVLKNKYTGQMHAYRKLIAEGLDLPPTAVSVSLISCPRNYRQHPAQVVPYADEELAEKQQS